MGRWLWDQLGSDEGKKAFILVPWYQSSVVSDCWFLLAFKIIAKAMSSTFNMGCVSKLVKSHVQPVLQSVPVASKEFHLSPWSFDFSERAKFGEKGRFPTNWQFKAHFGSFLKNGYEANREPIDVRFAEESESIEPFSVQFVDGQNKMLIIQSILALMEQCVFGHQNMSCFIFTFKTPMWIRMFTKFFFLVFWLIDWFDS